MSRFVTPVTPVIRALEASGFGVDLVGAGSSEIACNAFRFPISVADRFASPAAADFIAESVRRIVDRSAALPGFFQRAPCGGAELSHRFYRRGRRRFSL